MFEMIAAMSDDGQQQQQRDEDDTNTVVLADPTTTVTTTTTTISEGRRAILHGEECSIFQQVLRHATPEQWAEWLRAPLEHAAASGDLGRVLRLLRAGADARSAGWTGNDGRTLLGAAVEGRNEAVLTALLEAGAQADVNAVSETTRMSPLHLAARSGHPAIARRLMASGADVELLDISKRSALHYAVERGHREIVQDLLTIGRSRPNVEDGNLMTPLLLAAAQGHGHIVPMLLLEGACLDKRNRYGNCALHVAVSNGNVTAMKALLKAGVDVQPLYGTRGIISRLVLTAARHQVAILTTVLELGTTDVNRSTPAGYTALHEGAAYGGVGVVNALVEAGANIEAEMSDQTDGLVPLLFAADKGNCEAMVALLGHGADVNKRDNDGNGPLHRVCKFASNNNNNNNNRAVETLGLLLRWGADETATNNSGRTPVQSIGTGVDPNGHLRRLLENASADRAWRRRGLLVLCRALYSDEARVGMGTEYPSDGEEGEACCVPRLGRGRSQFFSGSSSSSRASGAQNGGSYFRAGSANRPNADTGALVKTVVGLEAAGVFRTIVGFL